MRGKPGRGSEEGRDTINPHLGEGINSYKRNVRSCIIVHLQPVAKEAMTKKDVDKQIIMIEEEEEMARKKNEAESEIEKLLRDMQQTF